MSFGAVLALIALASELRMSAGGGPPESVLERVLQWLLRSLAGLIGMTLVASVATAPFAAYHFQSLTPFGLIGNALALPLVSLVVMPAGLLGVLAYPFGLDRPVWFIMGVAVAKVLDLSAWVSGFEGSTVVVPAFGPGALALLSSALLIGTLLASSLRRLALIPAAAGLALAASPDRFDVLMDRDGAGAAVRGKAGRLVLLGRPSDFVVQQWLRADGDARGTDDPSLREGVRCDGAGCVAELETGQYAAFVRNGAAFEEDCRRAAIVLSPMTAPPTCKAALVLDRDALRRHGAVAARFREGRVDLRSTREEDGTRPWHNPSASEGTEAAASRPAGGPKRTLRSASPPGDVLSSGGPD